MKKYFFAGLAILLPLAVTIAVFSFVINFLTKPFIGFAQDFLTYLGVDNVGFLFLKSEQVLMYGSQLFILLALFVTTLGLGFIARSLIFSLFFHYSDKLLHKIPLVNKVYKTSQDIIQTLFSSEKNSFKQVVMAPFPTDNIYSLALVSRDSPKTCQEAKNTQLVSVFVPTTPNPTTGFLLMYKKEDLIFLDMTTEDAVKYIVSCGVIIPQPHQKSP
ncbi:MAG: DUF502 domain-containing protein [Chlamydiota bacterium]